MARTVVGTVTSDKGDKTIVVSFVERKTHPLYKKQYSVTKKFMAHDETNSAQEGDKVLIEETRPISARKTWKLVKILEQGGVKFVDPDAPVEAEKAEETTV